MVLASIATSWLATDLLRYHCGTWPVEVVAQARQGSRMSSAISSSASHQWSPEWPGSSRQWTPPSFRRPYGKYSASHQLFELGTGQPRSCRRAGWAVTGSRCRSWCSASRFESRTRGRSWPRSQHTRRAGRRRDPQASPTSSRSCCSRSTSTGSSCRAGACSCRSLGTCGL